MSKRSIILSVLTIVVFVAAIFSVYLEKKTIVVDSETDFEPEPTPEPIPEPTKKPVYSEPTVTTHEPAKVV